MRDSNELITNCLLQSVAATAGARLRHESPIRPARPASASGSPAARGRPGQRPGDPAIRVLRRARAGARQGTARSWLYQVSMSRIKIPGLARRLPASSGSTGRGNECLDHDCESGTGR